jgi:hypothetical protein
MRKAHHLKIGTILLILVSVSMLQCAIADDNDDVVVTLSFYGPNWDINHDGDTNYLDVSSLVSHYGDTAPPRPRNESQYRYDINGDGVVNYLDVSSLVSHYGEGWLVP